MTQSCSLPIASQSVTEHVLHGAVGVIAMLVAMEFGDNHPISSIGLGLLALLSFRGARCAGCKDGRHPSAESQAPKICHSIDWCCKDYNVQHLASSITGYLKERLVPEYQGPNDLSLAKDLAKLAPQEAQAFMGPKNAAERSDGVISAKYCELTSIVN